MLSITSPFKGYEQCTISTLAYIFFSNLHEYDENCCSCFLHIELFCANINLYDLDTSSDFRFLNLKKTGFTMITIYVNDLMIKD